MDPMATLDVIRAPLTETLPRLSAALAETVPHHALADLSPNCAYAPFKVYGEGAGEPGQAITTSEVAALRPHVPEGGSWQGRAQLAGADVPVLALASTITEPPALLVLVRTEDTPLPEDRVAPAQALWDVLTAHREGLRTEALPEILAVSRAAASARATAISELVDAHGAVLSALLGVLRDRDLDDSGARARGIDLTLAALVELRSRAQLDQTLVEKRAGDAFERLAESLRRMLRSRGIRLDLGRPGAEEGADRLLPGDVVNTASAAVRASVHASLEDQGSGPDGRAVSRIHVSWKVGAAELRATVRDDGPGTLSRSSLDARRVVDRLTPLGGRFEVDAVPDWGTTVTIEIPLTPPDTPRHDPLTQLGTRELEVLSRLARGRRNRDIAQELHISESTVKFHIAKIFDKLGVNSRGEAAALAHEWGAA
ncbi:helix-turn-helix transcriptional regulator [Streptomyces griseorubiginosus]|uniref:helix-turn-helix transcriptional regulator n=1 Tax=Streptomyces griseorubiginosus TaxID=67304 RepID=UPI001AD7183F|nr:response regulator transcription factor family protein [Streptomyces griseorubiginosus]MBO4253161.1 helix-turn-helix transcriptional regulator [Streptomyces griseorubiginosus]